MKMEDKREERMFSRVSGELQGEDEPGEDGMQHMWVSNSLGPMMPGRSFIPSDMCASEFLKINIFLHLHFPSQGNMTKHQHRRLFFILEHVQTRSKNSIKCFQPCRRQRSFIFI